MDEEIVRRWRKAVSPADTVYCLGDFAYRCGRSYAQDVLDRLPGRKVLVVGGHDWKLAVKLVGWADVRDMLVIRERGLAPVVLCHYPLLHWWNERRGAIMLHAHSHSRRMWFGENLRADCGVDATGFWPIPLSSVRAMARVRESAE